MSDEFQPLAVVYLDADGHRHVFGIAYSHDDVLDARIELGLRGIVDLAFESAAVPVSNTSPA